MRMPFFPSRPEEKPLRLALPEVIPVNFCVYAPLASPLNPESLQAILRAGLEQRAQEPLRKAILSFVDSEMLTLRVMKREEAPEPPLDRLRYFGLGEAEERCLERANTLIIVSTGDWLAFPRLGYWTALGGARALAAHFEGIALDPCGPSVLSLSDYKAFLPSDGHITISRHIRVLHSLARTGHAWITTLGMHKFGLPELEIQGAPAGLADALLPLVHGIAFTLARAVFQATEADEAAKELILGPEFRVSLDDVAQAHGLGTAQEPPAGARGWTILRLKYMPSSRHRPQAFLDLVPPLGFQGDQSVWLYSVLSDLQGANRPISLVPRDNETMEAAHLRAVAELPRIQERFRRGLGLGETLYVKHGFPIEAGGHEYMWITVHTWEGKRLQGQLANDPQILRNLQAGQTVDILEETVFDWLLSLSGGASEGGYTTRAAMLEGIQTEE